jgi:5-enolpyruvylshikimate-3-phosphate synthase
VATIEGAVAFYNGDAFNNSPAGQLLAGATGSGINLDATQVEAVAAFLRVINALENIRASVVLLEEPRRSRKAEAHRLAGEEIDDAIMVLAGAGLHADAIARLREARALAARAKAGDAIAALHQARDLLVGSP